MLDTSFARPRGDVGNPESWDFPVLLHVVRGAGARRVVDGDDAVVGDFIAGARALARQGALGAITSCGFLAAWQQRISEHSPIPVATSALLQIPPIARSLPGSRRVGVLTYDARALGPEHFLGVGADPDTPTAGLPRDGAFHRMIEHGAPYDPAALEAEVLAAARALLAAHRGIGAIVLECTNLPPFAAAIRAQSNLPVYDILTLGRWFHAGLEAGAGA